MTQNDHVDTSVPTIYLTEEHYERARAERAKMLDGYHRLLVDLKYLTIDEAFELQIIDTDYKWETNIQRIAKNDRHHELLEKIDLYKVYDIVNDEFQRKKKIASERKKHAGYDLGAREFTLTYSPKWFSDEEARLQMRRAIERICRYYKDGDQRIIRLRAVGEVGTNGLSHVHCYYKLLGGVKITDKNFKRAYPPWDTKVKQGPTGHKGGHHASVKHDSDFLGYIEKQVTDAWLDIAFPETADPE